jgi:hypothetical protein
MSTPNVPSDDRAHAAEVGHAGGCLREHAVTQGGPSAHEQEQEQRRAGHEAEAPELHQDHDDELTEAGPVRADVDQ